MKQQQDDVQDIPEQELEALTKEDKFILLIYEQHPVWDVVNNEAEVSLPSFLRRIKAVLTVSYLGLHEI
ncbi:Hypothetical predicted protein [Paramuricea clavata]|uniref:Uncharacterized protein n=1 Tax=Paramuricea clavata TaxID=317549 RepID=A0A7D9LSZ6_PARCT|nr:Hypothetical predicted protein [Paramuricea clavata]